MFFLFILLHKTLTQTFSNLLGFQRKSSVSAKAFDSIGFLNSFETIREMKKIDFTRNVPHLIYYRKHLSIILLSV